MESEAGVTGGEQVNPNATEYCDGIDNDCNDLVDDDAMDAVRIFEDLDGDGFGSNSVNPSVSVGSDCDDSDNTVYVGAASKEISLCTQDIDGDGWGNNTISGSDCDDGDGLLNQDDVDEDLCAVTT